MIDLLKQEAAAHGDRLQIFPVKRLEELKNELSDFKNTEELNGFQKWIVDHKYRLDLPSGFNAVSVIIAAIPHPPYAIAQFIRNGRKYSFKSLILSDFKGTEQYLRNFLEPRGHHLLPAPELPFKRLAVESGLAVYGRNNICYVKDMGSFLSFDGYYTDISCEDGDWSDVHMHDFCGRCGLCIKSCPTGAIRSDRFLIDNERCLSYFNEVPGDFPEWLPLSVHHTLYDCLGCQIKCPLNKEYAGNAAGPISFDETETEIILSGKKLDEFSPDLKAKVILLGLDQWLDAIPRNLKVLFELQDQKE